MEHEGQSEMKENRQEAIAGVRVIFKIFNCWHQSSETTGRSGDQPIGRSWSKVLVPLLCSALTLWWLDQGNPGGSRRGTWEAWVVWELRTQAGGYLTAQTAVVQYFNKAHGHFSAYVLLGIPGWCLGLIRAETDFREIAQIKWTGGSHHCFGFHIVGLPSRNSLLSALRGSQEGTVSPPWPC